MSQLLKLYDRVEEKNLSKEQLDELFSELSNVRARIRQELSGIQKEKAVFLLQNPEKSVAQRKLEWQASEKGQREIELKSYITSTSDYLNSVKTRIYSLL